MRSDDAMAKNASRSTVICVCFATSFLVSGTNQYKRSSKASFTLRGRTVDAAENIYRTHHPRGCVKETPKARSFATFNTERIHRKRAAVCMFCARLHQNITNRPSKTACARIKIELSWNFHLKWGFDDNCNWMYCISWPPPPSPTSHMLHVLGTAR